MTETSFFIVRFLQKFDKLESKASSGPIQYGYNILNRSAAGVRIKVHHAHRETASTLAASGLPGTDWS